MMEKLRVIKAELMMKVAGFVLRKHSNPVLDRAAKATAWVNTRRYGNDPLDFLENEESIDLMDDAKYEQPGSLHSDK